MSVTAADVEFRRRGVVSASTFGGGAGGGVTLRAGSLVINGAGAPSEATGIFAETEASRGGGTGGKVDVAADTLRLAGGGVISTQSMGDGHAGGVSVGGGRVSVGGGSAITSRAEGTGPAGDVSVFAGPVLSLRGSISTAAPHSTGGNIRVNLGGFLSAVGGRITTNAGGGDGGNITIDPVAVVLQRASLDASSTSAGAGNMTIRSDGLLNEGSAIRATGLTRGGEVRFTAPDTELAGTLAILPGGLAATGSQLVPQCVMLLGAFTSSFSTTGRGGTPPEPGGWSPDWVFDAPPAGAPFHRGGLIP